MSLILPMMIGSNTIGAIVINRQERLNKKNAVHTYTWELGMKEGQTLRGARPAESHSGTVEHVYEDGAVVLLKKIFDSIPMEALT